jgi:hypothetical protein
MLEFITHVKVYLKVMAVDLAKNVFDSFKKVCWLEKVIIN